MPAKKKSTAKRSASSSGGKSAPTGPVSCLVNLQGNPLVIDATTTSFSTSWKRSTYFPSGLHPSAAHRSGHAAFMSPDHRHICVVGGAVEDDGTHARLWDDTACSTSSDEEPETPKPKPPPKKKKKAGRPASKKPPLPEAALGTSAKKKPGDELPTTQSTASGGAANVPSARRSKKASAASADAAEAAEPEEDPAEVVRRKLRPKAHPLVTLPATWRSRVPLVECLSLSDRMWFTPLGEQERAQAAAAEGVEARGAAVRWPPQASIGVIWERKEDDDFPLSGMRSPRTPSSPGRHSPLQNFFMHPNSRDHSPTRTNKSTTAARTSGAADDASAAAGGHATFANTPGDVTPPSPTVALVLPAPFASSTNTAPTGSGSPDNSGDEGDKPLNPKLARWVAGPDEVCVVGGWDGTRRLSHALTYSLYHEPKPFHTSSCRVTDAAARRKEALLRLTMPRPAAIGPAALPALSRHSGTQIKDTIYVFGGNTADGCSNDLYALRVPELAMQQEKDLVRALESSMSASKRGSVSALMRLKDQVRRYSSSNTEMHDNPGWTCELLSGASLPPPPPPDPEPEMPLSATTSASRRHSRAASSALAATTTSDALAATTRPNTGSMRAAQGPLTVPEPPARSSHAACALAERYLIIIGGRRLVFPEEAPAPTKGKGGKASRKSVKDTGAPPPPPAPTLEVLGDVVAYDTEERRWMQVKVSGGEAPPPRYGAAVCALPASANVSDLPSTFGATLHASSLSLSGAYAVQRELVMHGGIGADGECLSDAWVLQAIGKAPPVGGAAASVLVEVDYKTGIPSLPVRWVRIRTDAPPSAAPDTGNSLSESAAGKSQDKIAAAGENAAAASKDKHKGKDDESEATPPPAPTGPRLPQRAFHALVAAPSREVYILGGTSHAEGQPPPPPPSGGAAAAGGGAASSGANSMGGNAAGGGGNNNNNLSPAVPPADLGGGSSIFTNKMGKAKEWMELVSFHVPPLSHAYEEGSRAAKK